MARPSDAATVWHDDDDVEMKQSLHQKEAITAQMISIISTRLNSLQTVGASHAFTVFIALLRPTYSWTHSWRCALAANNRKLGLDCDLRVNSDYCSKMVRCSLTISAGSDAT